MPPKRPLEAGAAGAAPAAKRAKAPASDSRRIEAAVLRALRNTPAGLAQDALATRCKVSKMELALALNGLTRRRQVQLAKGPDGDILFMLTSKQDVEAASRLDELSTNELHVYQTIQDKARDGIWKRDIKHKTGLVEKEVEKILKTLQKKKLVKMEKTVLRQNGKMFFLYDIQPSAEHTGGVWYSRPRPGDPSQAPEFDSVGVKDIADACHKFVCNENQCRSTFYANHGAHLRWAASLPPCPCSYPYVSDWPPRRVNAGCPARCGLAWGGTRLLLRSNPSIEDIHAWVAEHKLYKEELALENIQQIMMVRALLSAYPRTRLCRHQRSPPACSSEPAGCRRRRRRWWRWRSLAMADAALRRQGRAHRARLRPCRLYRSQPRAGSQPPPRPLPALREAVPPCRHGALPLLDVMPAL
jgi:hypothetical protein